MPAIKWRFRLIDVWIVVLVVGLGVLAVYVAGDQWLGRSADGVSKISLLDYKPAYTTCTTTNNHKDCTQHAPTWLVCLMVDDRSACRDLDQQSWGQFQVGQQVHAYYRVGLWSGRIYLDRIETA